MARPVKKTLSSEGLWCGIPLEAGGFGAAIVLRVERTRARDKLIMLSGLGVKFETCPTIDDLGTKTIFDIRSLISTGDYAIVSGRWKSLGVHPGFSQERWPFLPVRGSDTQFATCDNDGLDYAHFRRDLVDPALHNYFLQPVLTMPHHAAMEVVILDILEKQEKSRYYYRVTQAHLDAYEKIKPIIKKHGR